VSTTDENQVYVTGVLYNSSAFPDDPQDLFDIVDEKFRELDELSFADLNINRSETRFSDGETREQLLIFMKGVSWDGSNFLSDTNSNTLRNNLVTKLNSISGLSYTDVEIRTSRETT